jgi:hypothetical protein
MRKGVSEEQRIIEEQVLSAQHTAKASRDELRVGRKILFR